jgi:4-hydroxybenzoate polyprenyltransferase
MIFEKKNKNLLNIIEKQKFDFKFWLVSFLFLITTRLFVEGLLLGLPIRTLESFVVLFSHTFLFFVLTYIIFLIFLFFLIKEKLEKIANFLLWGFLIIIFPPIVDKFIFGDEIYKSFYLFDSVQGLMVRFFTFFGENPDWGITYGARVNIAVSLIFLTGYIYLKTQNKTKTLLGILGSYLIFFLLSSFPSIVVYFLEIFKIKEVSYSTVAGYFMTPFTVFGLKGEILESFMARKLALIYLPLFFLTVSFFWCYLDFKKCLSLIKNIRFPQMIFNGGILFIGLGLGWFYYPENFQLNFFGLLVVVNLILVVFSSWFFSVFVNDYFDLKVDEISNKNRPLIQGSISIKENWDYAWFFFFISLLGALVVGPIFFLIIMVYHLLTWVYSSYPFRLKRFIGVSNILIAFSSLIFLILGFLVFSDFQTLEKFPWTIYWFLFVAYFLITPLKDLKDLEGDRKNAITTLPTLFGKKNTRLLVSVFLLSLYLSSVYILRKTELFLPAVFFGGVSFYLINSSKISEKNLNYGVLGLVFLYGVLLIKIIFL